MISIDGMAIAMSQGDDLCITYNLTNIADILTQPCTARWTMKKRKSDASALITKEVSLDAGAKTLFIHCTKEEMSLDIGYYYFWIDIIIDGVVQNIGNGNITMKGVVHDVQ